MNSSLRDCLLSAQEQFRSRARLMLQRCIPREELEENFSLAVKNEFLAGVHTAYVKEIVRRLGKLMPTQQEQADALGLKDRTSISKMNSSGTIDGVRLTAILCLYPDLITHQATRKRATLYGFARATSFIKARAYKNATIEGTMSPQDFSYVIGVLASSEWASALRSPDARAAREVGARIVREQALTLEATSRQGDQNVLMLQELCASWAEFVMATLWVIPECIPTEDTQ